MALLTLRFYEELNDFLPPQKKQQPFSHPIDRKASIKDVIESLGVPHTEVELILVNGHSVDFQYQVQDRDEISVYPVFESFNISPLLRLRDKPLRHLRFVADSNLGKLSQYLRLLGFDCLYRNDYEDAEVAEISHQQHRVVLTRDRRLLKRKIITHGYFVRSDQPRQQVGEIMSRFDLYDDAEPFTRCVNCNGQLVKINKAAILDRIEPLTRKHYDDFKICEDCGQIFWPGSHFKRAGRLLKELIPKRE
ncbi:Mut7-C RNAse domain-containing protein [Methylophaga sp.]|jgi:uncharacterized protein with PIN domain/sulfur carrier protein ThiS|uniref:Mut7-C RNAse domain-containing protein n=1 Tax=Methylophaga sp. TaxID=2024840 RepID=UPI0013FE7665|nr:Mut7-C RNAse domain-containing protein [Methylophaga sp.]MTI63910.1 twitching motility protein PilT [Methylophaga sp.]